MIKCDKCGADNWEGAKFCSQCGNSLETPPEPPEPAPDPDEWDGCGCICLLIIAGAILAWLFG